MKFTRMVVVYRNDSPESIFAEKVKARLFQISDYEVLACLLIVCALLGVWLVGSHSPPSSQAIYVVIST